MIAGESSIFIQIVPVQCRLLLAMSCIGHSHSFLAAFRFHGRDVEDEVGVHDARAGRRGWPPDLAVLAEGVANPANLQVLLGHLNLSAHGVRLAGVLAVRMRVARLKKHLVLLTFPAKEKKV